MSLTSTQFEALVSRLIYYPTAYPTLPRLIATVHDRDSQGLGKVLASALAAMAAEVNRSTYLAVECRDRPHYRDKLPAGSNVLDRLQPYGLCDDWSEIGPAPLVPTRNLSFPETPMANWSDITPRIGSAVDLFGDGSTALKVSINKYVSFRYGGGAGIGILSGSVKRFDV